MSSAPRIVPSRRLAVVLAVLLALVVGGFTVVLRQHDTDGDADAAHRTISVDVASGGTRHEITKKNNRVSRRVRF